MKVALVAIVKEESNLKEWIDYHRSWGFDDVYLLCNDWRPEEKLKAKLIDVPGKGVQIMAYNKWIEFYGKRYDYAAFFDADEYIYITNHTNVKQILLPGYSLGINWVFFGNYETPDQTGVISRFRYRARYIDKHIKSIVRMDKGVCMPGVHHSNDTTVSPECKILPTVPFNDKGSMDNVFLAHYYQQDREYFKKKIIRGRADIPGAFRQFEEWYHYADYCNEVKDERILNHFNQIL